MYMYVFLRDKPFFLCNEHNCGKIKNRSFKYTIYSHVICCVKKKFHFLDCGQSMSFTDPMIHVCAFRLSVWKLFAPILGSIASFSFSEIVYKSRRTFCFPFLQTSAICIFLPCLLVTCMFFFGRSRCFRCCVTFFIIWLLLSSKERVQWALYLFPFQHTLAHVLIHQRKIDKDLQNQIITKAAILYPNAQCILFLE